MNITFARPAHQAAQSPAHCVAFLTCHDKAHLVSDALAPLGLDVQPISSYDTDKFGTFSREIPRRGSAHDTALRKAKLACSLAATRYGLGSEGSFGPDPHLGWMPWNYEILCLWDNERQYAVYVMASSGATNYAQGEIDSLQAAESFMQRTRFPSHALILGRPDEPWFQKGIRDRDWLLDKIATLLTQHPALWFETDMRAHLNPLRQQMIREAGEQLAKQLGSLCPRCSAPGYAIARSEPGLSCADCDLSTPLAAAYIWECPACEYQERIATNQLADPGHCERCNP